MIFRYKRIIKWQKDILEKKYIFTISKTFCSTQEGISKKEFKEELKKIFFLKAPD